MSRRLRHAVLAHRESGELKTVTTDEALGLVASGRWFLAYCEVENGLNCEDREWTVHTSVAVRCNHGPASNPCPTWPTEQIELLPADQWTAEDLRFLESKAAETLQTDCLLWNVRVTDAGRSREPKTCVRIEPGRAKAKARGQEYWHGMHSIEIEFAGHASAVTLAWLMRQSVRMELSLITTTDPDETAESGGWLEPNSVKVTKLPSAKSTGDTTQQPAAK